MYMQSNGGLVDATSSQGKDAILSGPAGGIVGGRQDCCDRGLREVRRLRHGRHLHRRDALMRASSSAPSRPRCRRADAGTHDEESIPWPPAAGRSSPSTASASASDPRAPAPIPAPPAIAGRSLGVTDANLMVGKLLPDFFPHVFVPTPTPRSTPGSCASASRPWPRRRATPRASKRSARENRPGCLAIANDKHGERDQGDIDRARHRRSRDTRSSASAAPAASTPARWPTSSASRACRSTPTPRCSRPMAWGWRMCRHPPAAIDRTTGGRHRDRAGGGAPGPREGAVAELAEQESTPRTTRLEPGACVRYAGTDTAIEVPFPRRTTWSPPSRASTRPATASPSRAAISSSRR